MSGRGSYAVDPGSFVELAVSPEYQLTSISTITYDAMGRVLREETDGGGYEVPAPTDGVVDAQTVTRYFPDGRKASSTSASRETN